MTKEAAIEFDCACSLICTQSRGTESEEGEFGKVGFGFEGELLCLRRFSADEEELEADSHREFSPDRSLQVSIEQFVVDKRFEDGAAFGVVGCPVPVTHRSRRWIKLTDKLFANCSAVTTLRSISVGDKPGV